MKRIPMPGYRLTFSIALLACACAAPQIGAADLEEAARRVVEQTNRFRTAQRLSEQAVNATLGRTAREFARFMAKTGKYGHTADGRTPAERASAHGYDYCVVLENIAYVYRSRDFPSATELAADMVEGWKQSPEHRKAMLDDAATETGVAIARDRDGRYFGVQMFGRPKSAAIRFSVTNRSNAEIRYRAGERTFSLPPRSTREHTVCRPLTLAVTPPSGKPFSAVPGDGAQYTVTPEGVRQ